MEKTKVFELRADYDQAACAIVLELVEEGVSVPRAVRSVSLQPHSSYHARVRLARQWLASVVGVSLEQVKGAS